MHHVSSHDAKIVAHSLQAGLRSAIPLPNDDAMAIAFMKAMDREGGLQGGAIVVGQEGEQEQDVERAGRATPQIDP